jgi:hypothetical protein
LCLKIRACACGLNIKKKNKKRKKQSMSVELKSLLKNSQTLIKILDLQGLLMVQDK